jgi:hypothetical protein
MICLTLLHDSFTVSPADPGYSRRMKMFIPHSDLLSDQVINELGLNLGDLVPFQLDYECLRLGDHFTDAEIHGPPSAWEGVEA